MGVAIILIKKSYIQAIPYFEHCIKLIDNPKDG